MAVRFSLELLAYALLIAGALAAVGGDKLSMVTVRDVGILIAFLGAVAFGLEMIVKRRADITTRYSDTINPVFHAGMLGIPVGLCILAGGLLRTVSPATADALRAAVRDWLIGLIPR
jgi:hypothetical protein